MGGNLVIVYSHMAVGTIADYYTYIIPVYVEGQGGNEHIFVFPWILPWLWFDWLHLDTGG